MSGIYTETWTLDVASSGTTSTPFRMGDHTKAIGFLFPAMDDGDVTLHMSIDEGLTYHPVIDITDGNDLVIIGSGDDPGFVTLTDQIQGIPPDARLRIVCAAQSSGAIEIKAYCRG